MKFRTVDVCTFVYADSSPSEHVFEVPEDVIPTIPDRSTPDELVYENIAGPPESPLHVLLSLFESNMLMMKLFVTAATVAPPRLSTPRFPYSSSPYPYMDMGSFARTL